MDSSKLRETFEAVAAGRLSASEAVHKVRTMPFEGVGNFASVDLHRGVHVAVGHFDRDVRRNAVDLTRRDTLLGFLFGAGGIGTGAQLRIGQSADGPKDNFAAVDAMALIELWGITANDLAVSSEVAAATLTKPLRDMFGRLGVPLHVLAPASADRLGHEAAHWGSYYELDPQVCIGEIAAGQRAISALLRRRRSRNHTRREAA